LGYNKKEKKYERQKKKTRVKRNEDIKKRPRRASTVGIHQFAKHRGKGENLCTLGILIYERVVLNFNTLLIL
jgi:hypothetical protein